MSAFLMTDDGDLDISSGNLKVISGIQEIKQLLLCRLRFFKASWFLDLEEGVPYYQEILIKNPDMSVVKAIFREVITETPGVLRLESIDLDFDPIDRALSVSLSITAVTGDAFNVNERFLIGDV